MRKHFVPQWPRLLLVAVVAMFATACRDSVKIYDFPTAPGTPSTPQTPKVQSVSVLQSTISLKVGENQFLNVQVLPAGINPNVYWMSMDTSIVTVSASGQVTGKKAGTTRVRAASTVDTTIVGFSTVTVTAVPVNPPAYVVALIVYSGSPSADTVLVGATKTHSMPRVDINLAGGGQRTLAPNEVSQYVKFFSSNLAAISVDSITSTVTGLHAGQGQVIACARTQLSYCYYDPKVFVVKP